MARLARIRDQILPITVVAVIIAVGYYTFTKTPPRGTLWDIAEWVLLLVIFCVLFSIFPAVAIIYGWYTGNKIGAVLAGILALPLVYLAGFILLRPGNMVFFISSNTLPFIAALTVISGLAGYCAAQRTRNYLAASIVLTGVWLIVWMSGFN
ncbi:MAG: hypothetical protein A4E35_01580 [Methanoregula sp. PtaU1.Bin051]|nr:MAG: hypothetical protein A4E35_01580 [Methanoregula sp. PtaU1.Bin051]